MHKLLLALTLVLPTNYANHVNHANFIGWKLRKAQIMPANNRVSHVAEHRRELLSDLDTIIGSTNDDYFSDTLQLDTEEERNEGESGLIDLSLDETSDGTSDGQYDVRCAVVEECAYCSDYKNDASPICQATGRREKIECTFSSSENTRKEKRTKFRSCRRTKKDEEFLVMQLQLICVITTYFSLRSVRREKLKSVSLFDQRAVRRRPHISSNNNMPASYTEVQQVDNGCRKDTNMQDNLLHESGSSDGNEKLDNKV